MNINLKNYEAYILDYHEGSLSQAMVKELLEFIAKHPELKQDFESFEAIIVKDDERITFEQKHSLKKQLNKINSSNFDDYAIEYVEGVLPIALQQELKTFVTQNPHYQKELELYGKTKLTPDPALFFGGKLLLKKRQRRPAMWFYWSAAASVALLIAAFFMLRKNGTSGRNTIVKNEHTVGNDINTKQTTKQNNTTLITAHNIPNATVNNKKTDSTVLVNRVNSKHQVNGVVSSNLLKNSSPVAVVNRMTNNIKRLPDLTQKTIPVFPETTFAVTSNNLEDNAFISTWIMKYNSNIAAQQEDSIAEPYNEKPGRKFLYILAKITCKGLHEITGQHIKMEKKFDSDTTNIIAYQLDLGKKKYEFPVKE